MKNIKPFESFVNEEVTDTYLRDKIAKAKEGGRQISSNYEEELHKKRNKLEDADRVRKIESERKQTEENWKKFVVTAEEIQTSLRQADKIFNVDGLPFKVSQVRAAVGPELEIHLKPTETQRIDRIVISYKSKTDDMKSYIYDSETSHGKIFPIARLSEFFGTLTQVFKKYFPESKFADRKMYSALESKVIRFEDFEKVDEKKSEVEKLEDQLENELKWVRKYSKFVDRGSYPKDDYNDEAEFYSDLEKTENNIERLKKLIKEKK